MGKYDKREFQVGEYWLGKRAGSPAWHRFWFDRPNNRTQRVSLETTDLEQAKRKLALWYASQGEGPIGDRAMLEEVLDGYYEAHGKKLPSHQTAKRGVALWKEYFGNIPAEDAMKPYRIELFRDWLNAKGLSTSYTARVIGVGGAALTRAG